MKKYILNPIESKDSIKKYIHNLEDMSNEIGNLTWELQPTQIGLLNEAAQKMSEAMELLQQARDTPQRFVVNY